jgi:hypothetical protein
LPDSDRPLPESDAGPDEPPESDAAAPLAAPSPALPAASRPSPLAASAAGLVRVRVDDERSFFAQPDPLKWTVGGANALRSVPSAPHAGQNRGPGASMPWITSVSCRQDEQR